MICFIYSLLLLSFVLSWDESLDLLFSFFFQVDHLRQMFQVVWGPILAGLSVTLENAEHEQWVSFCLKSFMKAIHVA